MGDGALVAGMTRAQRDERRRARRLFWLGLLAFLAFNLLAGLVDPCDGEPGCYPPGVHAPK